MAVTDNDEPSDLGSMGSLLRGLAETPSVLVQRGVVIDGQYKIERVLGSGAMGIVYLARDQRLERDVAIKLAREASPTAIARSTREALALARLSHPNVVVVYQVGEVDERMYVAMEYVEGTTARGWVEGRSRAEIVTMYLTIGEGLAAAHAVGLVHRDFKPDNVLVGTDGRPRIADFGLARSPIASRPEDLAGAEPTATTVAGTRAYMAPEQFRGEAEPRTDQFAYCVSLWEALHGTRPFAEGDLITAETLEAALAADKLVRGPERARGVPPHITAALRRGLSSSPDARWPDMSALLAELRRDPTRNRRRVLAGGGAVLAIGATVAIVMVARPAAEPSIDPCDGGPARIAKRWTPARADILRGKIHEPAPAKITDDTIADITGYADKWAASYRNVCESAAWTPALRDKGMSCLANAEHRLDATLETLEEPAPFAGFSGILAQLGTPEACADAAYLGRSIATPTDPKLATEFATTHNELMRIRNLSAIGKIARAKELFAPIEKAGTAIPMLLVEIHYTAAVIARQMGDEATLVEQLRTVYYAARSVEYNEIAALAATNVAEAMIDASRDKEADEWVKLAEVEATAAADPDVRIRSWSSLSTVATARNDPQRGLELADRALKLNASYRNRALDRMEGLRARGKAQDLFGHFDLALADFTEALALLEGVHGEHDPNMTLILISLSLTQIHAGKFADAIVSARRALAIAERFDPGGEYEANAIGQLGVALTQTGAFVEALALIDRSMELDKKHYGADSFNVASDYNNRADLLQQMGRHLEAIESGQKALAMFVAVVGEDGQEVGSTLHNIANAAVDAGKFQLARDLETRAIAIFAKQPDDPTVAILRIVRAEAALRLKDTAAATADLEATIALLGKTTTANPTWLPWAKLDLARLEAAAGHRDRAKALATEARDAFEPLGDHRVDEAQKIVDAS